MIFVTVGTHEQQFDRLVSCVDALKRDGVIQEDVFIQTGYSTYEPKYCRWSKLIPYEEMIEHVKQARIVVTHGGPASFIMPLQMGKVPVVVPRQFRFGEHVNDHQVDFCRAVSRRMGSILLVEDVSALQDAIAQYDTLIKSCISGLEGNNAAFNAHIREMAAQLLRQKTDV